MAITHSDRTGRRSVDAAADTDTRVAAFVSFSGRGGVERMVLRLLGAFVERGFAVDLIAVGANALAEPLPPGVRLVDAGTDHTRMALPALCRYLRRQRPAALLAAKDRAIRTAIVARALTGVPTRLVGRLGTNLSAALEGRSAIQRWWRCAPMQRLYPRIDAVVAVSEGVAADTRHITGLPAERVHVVRNPVITTELPGLIAEPVVHRWLDTGSVPVVMGAGRLTRQKDFVTLIRAFARMRRVRDARLIILGEGGERSHLETCAAEAGVAEAVDLVGQVHNPYAWMARADLFVLSSAWEGSPNVLTEAAACGTPVVATNCPSGPRELLADGRYGPLVPVGDDEALATAMAHVLAEPTPASLLREAVAGYTVEASADGYLRCLGLEPADDETRTESPC